MGRSSISTFGCWERQRNLFSAQGGSFGFTLLPVERFDGARFGTSRAYVNDAAVAQGSALTVLLTREARVDAYRGDELLGSAYLAAGVQQFDTRYFPEGAYLVTLRIFEGDTLVRTESEPYTKVGGGAFGAGTQWFVQGGKTVNRRQSANAGPGAQATVQSGVRTSFGPGLTFATGLVWLPSRVYNETQVGWQHGFALGRLTTTASLLTGIRQDTNGSQPQQRIEYRLGMNYAGAYQWLRIGDAGGTAFGSVSQAPIRIVRLPGMPVAVACTPAALAFEIVPFLESEKDAGRYDGRIRIEMFVDAAGI